MEMTAKDLPSRIEYVSIYGSEDQVLKQERYNEAKQSYDATVDKYSARIKERVYNINFYKERIKSELLPEFIKSLKKFCDFPIPESLQMEEYVVETLTVEDMKSKRNSRHPRKIPCRQIQ